MATAILCIASFLPSVAVSAIRIKRSSSRLLSKSQQSLDSIQQPYREARQTRYDADAVAIVFAAYNDPPSGGCFVKDACDVTQLLMYNGMDRSRIRLFLPHVDDSCPTAGKPDFTTGTATPVEALITRNGIALSEFCYDVKRFDDRQLCSDELLPTATNFFFHFSGHGGYEKPGIRLHSAFTKVPYSPTDETDMSQLQKKKKWDEVVEPKMFPKRWRSMVETGWKETRLKKRAWGRLLVILDACHSGVSFLTMLPTTSGSRALAAEKKKQLGQLKVSDTKYLRYYGEGASAMISKEIPFVVITSTGVQECKSIRTTTPGVCEGGYFTELMSRVWLEATPKHTVEQWQGAIKRRSWYQQVRDSRGRAQFGKALFERGKRPRTRTSPKFFGHPQHLRSFQWSEFYLVGAKPFAVLDDDSDENITTDDEGDSVWYWAGS